jgi:zinc/manganese transport system ATP-binding protein
MTPRSDASRPVLELRDASLSFGPRALWSELNLDVHPGEFLAVLGANGSGKTTLLRVLLGLLPLTSGQVLVQGQPARRGSRDIGYIQQQRPIDQRTPLRVKDVVRQGLDGHQWGIGRPGRVPWGQVEQALAAVDAQQLADMPIGVLSGGEQQRVRIAQALVADPTLLLCDEPLLSLDPSSQGSITALIDARRRDRETAVLFVTHEINPVLPYVDRVLYLADGRFRVGSVEEVLNSATLTELYGSPIEVIRSGNRILVAGVPEAHEHTHHPLPDAGLVGR